MLTAYNRLRVSLQPPSVISLMNCLSPRSWTPYPGVPDHSSPLLERRHSSGHLQQIMGKFQVVFNSWDLTQL